MLRKHDRNFYINRQKNGKRFIYNCIPSEIQRDCLLTIK